MRQTSWLYLVSAVALGFRGCHTPFSPPCMLVEPLLVLPKEPPEMRNKKWFAAACCVLFLSTPAAAQNWPTKPALLVGGLPPGGSTIARLTYLPEPLIFLFGPRAVVANRVGANGAMG